MKLPFKIKPGYGAAILGGGLCYVLFYSFFLLFLTDFAGVNPAWAGSISLVVVLWDAITDPIIGHMSDHWKGKGGRRRPFILFGILPWVISVIGMFLVVSFGPVGQFVYYLAMALLFWTAYTIVIVPHRALGAELTDDYSERASLSLFGQFFSSLGTTLAGSCTLLLMSTIAMRFGIPERQAWLAVAVIFAVVSAIGLFITWKTLEGHDSYADEKAPKESLAQIFGGYISLVRDVKPMKWILLSIFTFMIGNSLYGSGIVYAFTHLAHYNPAQIAETSLFLSLIGLGGPVVLNLLVKKFDKRKIVTVSLLISALDMIVFRFIGVGSTPKLYTYLIFYAISNVSYWGMIWAFVYDCCEVDTLLTGQFRQGTTTSFATMIQKIGSAVSMWLIGVILASGGYNGMALEQTPEALTAILNIITMIPGVLTLLSCIFLYFYPINSANFAKVQKALKDKNETGTYSKDGIENLL